MECGQRWHCHLCRRLPTRLVDTWSGGGTVPTYSSSSSETYAAPFKQLEHIQAFRLRASQMLNGASENLQPLFVRQVIASTPMTWINAMCMDSWEVLCRRGRLFTGNAGVGWRGDWWPPKPRPAPRFASSTLEAELCPPQSGLFPPRDRGENCE